MILAGIILSNRDWLWLFAGVVLFTFALLVWAYWRTPSLLCRFLCPLLKAIGIAALAFCLLEPLTVSQRARPGANIFAIVADNSQGLQLKDAGEEFSRGEMLKKRLQPVPNGWQEKLADNFDARDYYFDTRLQPTKDFSELKFNGLASALGGALRGLKQRFEGRPFAGVLLFTDGNATDIRAMPETTGLPPIYPVVIGSPEPVPDLAFEQVKVTQTDFEDAPVSIQADLRTSGFEQEGVALRVLDETGKVVSEQELTAQSREQVLTFRFQLRPEKPGLNFYRVVARSAGEKVDSTSRANTREATLENNERVVTVNRGKGPYRILYVAGRPNWEFKFLNRSLASDRMLELVGLIRVAKREPKFNFIGRAGESSNPLFRGFGEQSPEEVERYDQPVLVRLNTLDESELSSGFPQTPEALYRYHAIIVDDLESEFFKPDQATLLQKFVSERGGGFLMLGGMESFREGNYQRTPIGDMLPVYLDTDAPSQGGEVRMGITKEGMLNSWARLRETEGDERSRLQDMKAFEVLNRVGGARPGATVIASAKDEAGKELPALVVQRFGHGRTAALTIGDIYRWGMRNKESHADMDKAWRQLVRWLVNDAPNRVELTVDERPEDETGGVRFDVRVRDEAFQPMENAGVRLMVEAMGTNAPDRGTTNTTKLLADPSSTELGLYQASYVPIHPGGYKVTAFVTNSVGVEVGRAEAGWSTNPAEEEFRSLTPNLPLLEHLARETGGEVIRVDKLDEFAKSLPNRQAPIMEPWVRPLWHTPAVFGFALLCLVSEWGVRRWKGMP